MTETPRGDISLRPMTIADVAAVHRIERLVQRPGWSKDVLRAEVSRSDAHYVVAERSAELVGFAGMVVILDEGHITNVAVHPDAQGLGIGKQLVAELIAGARERDVVAMTLEVRVSNEPALALYRHFGFGPVGVRPRYYADNGEDALIMWRHGLAEANQPEAAAT